MADSPVFFKIITNNISSNPILPMMVPSIWLIYIKNHNVNRGRRKGDRQQLRNIKNKGKHKIGCYPKSLIIVTSYQVQGWCTMILSPVKDQPDRSNVTETILRISWHTHLNHSNSNKFFFFKWRILQIDFLLISSMPQK